MTNKNNTLSGLFPFGVQKVPGQGKGNDFTSLFYSAGIPGLYNGRWTSIYSDQFNKALMNGKNPNSIMPWGSAQSDQTSQQGSESATEVTPKMNWSFPQYSQSWAFTSPVAPSYTMPPTFNKKNYT